MRGGAVLNTIATVWDGHKLVREFESRCICFFS